MVRLSGVPALHVSSLNFRNNVSVTRYFNHLIDT